MGRRWFFLGLLLLCASTLMYEIILTRLLSVTSWYYLAFVSVSIAMFGMTAGALVVQLRPALFPESLLRRRLLQAALATAISMPLALLTMLAIPLDLSYSAQTIYSFVLFSAVIAVPFFFSGIGVCVSLTRSPFPMGRIYFTDLTGAALGCAGSVLVLRLVDAPSAIFVTSAFLFLSAAAYAHYATEMRKCKTSMVCAAAMLAVAGLNGSTLHGIQPIWSKGQIDRRTHIAAEVWNPISRVRIQEPSVGAPPMWGPSPRMPKFQVEFMHLDIDNDAGTTIMRFDGDLASHQYLRYDVTSLAAQLRPNGTAAVIGVGGGRDVLNCAINGFRRIVGIEVNGAIVDLVSRKYNWFSGFSKIPGFELHNDEGRSYLTRSGEHFDLIQASLVDTWAATSAGAMTLSENALYTVDGWRVFYEHLRPGGIITFSRWFTGINLSETYRLVSVAHAMLLSEGVQNPENQLALIQSASIATLLVSNQPFSSDDISKILAISNEMSFKPLMMPREPATISELRRISATRSLREMAALEDANGVDYSPTFDSSPYFFNAVHLKRLLHFLPIGFHDYGLRTPNLRAILFLAAFMLASMILVALTIILPARLWTERQDAIAAEFGGMAYFIAIGLGFMFIEMGFMQQLSIFLGHPIYSQVVVLAGLILSTGIGSLASDKWKLNSAWHARAPALGVFLIIYLYSLTVIPTIHRFSAGLLWQRIIVCLVLIAPCGFLLGFCFPVGMRSMTASSQQRNLPWMWALNGAAGTLGTFAAMMLSMDTSIKTCVLAGAGCYFLAGLVLPARTARETGFPQESPKTSAAAT
jgi:hypothetical protein